MDNQKIEVILFTHKESSHLSLGRSFLKTMGKDEGKDICEDYECMFETIRGEFGELVSSKKIYVDKVQGVREKYQLEIIPTLQIANLVTSESRNEDSCDIQKRFSGNIDKEIVLKYIENLIYNIED